MSHSGSRGGGMDIVMMVVVVVLGRSVRWGVERGGAGSEEVVVVMMVRVGAVGRRVSRWHHRCDRKGQLSW